MPVQDTYMRIAIEIIAETRTAIPNSVNYDATSSTIRTASGAPLFEKCNVDVFKGVRSELKSIIQRWQSRPTRDDKGANRQFVAEMAKAALGSNCGNCGELAFVSADKLSKKGIGGVDVIKVRPSDPTARTNTRVVPHWFSVIGRSGGATSDNTDIGLPGTWNANAVVVDAWDRVAYSASDFNNYWDGLRQAANGHDLTCELWCRL